MRQQINILTMIYNSYNSNQGCIFDQDINNKQQHKKTQKINIEDSCQAQNSILISNQDIFSQDICRKKQQNKQKYRKLKQKLNGLCSTALQQSHTKISKQFSSQNKSRLLALGIQFEKLSQTKDYALIQTKLRQIIKILQLKKQTDILILKHSKFISAISFFLSKIPTLYKNQFISSLRIIQLGLKILQIFCTISYNRQYVITNNMIIILHNCLGVLIQKQERKLAIQFFKIITELITGHSSIEIRQIIVQSLQIVSMSQLGKKLKQGLENCITEKIIDQEFILRILRYLSFFLQISLQKIKEKPVYTQIQMFYPIKLFIQSLITTLFKILSRFIVQNQLIDIQCQQLPIVIINASFYLIKVLNMMLDSNTEYTNKLIQKQAKQKQKNEQKSNSFLKSLLFLFKYSKQGIQNGDANYQLRSIYPQIMIFISKLCCFYPNNRDYFAVQGFIQLIFDHPITFIIDNQCKKILLPCLCAVMMGSSKNIKSYICDNSIQSIVAYLRINQKRYEQKQRKNSEDIANCVDQSENQQSQFSDQFNPMKMVRKLSQSSFNSYTTQGTQNSCCYSQRNMNEDERQMNRLLLYLPYDSWECLINQLIKFQQ